MRQRVLLMLGICCCQVLLFAQKATNFPEDYLGSYKGPLVMKTPSGEQTISMEFHLNATDTEERYEYQIIYINQGNRQVRSYTLIVKDELKGDYLVDEHNGIELEAKLFGNKLFSVFEVEQSLLLSTQTFFKDHMLFEILFSRSDKGITTGNNDATSPEVISYPLSVYQSATLEKFEN